MKTITLGRWPGTRLAAARRDAIEAATALAEGKDPAEKKRELERERVGALTVAACAAKWKESPEAGALGRDTRYEWLRLLAHDILPRLGKFPAATLRRQEVAELLDAIVGKGRRIATAKHARAVLSRVLRWAHARGLISRVPDLPRVSGTLPPRERTLSDLELSVLWGRASWNGTLGQAVCFAMLTGLRRNEVLGANWSDLRLEDQQTWLVLPGPRMKAGRTHRVPLFPMALEVLGERGSGPVFPTLKGTHHHLDSVGLRKVFRHVGIRDASIHDVRRTVLSRIAAEFGLEAAAHVGGHILRGVTARHYASGPALYDRSKARSLEWWTARLREIVTQGPSDVERGMLGFPVSKGFWE